MKNAPHLCKVFFKNSWSMIVMMILLILWQIVWFVLYLSNIFKFQSNDVWLEHASKSNYETKKTFLHSKHAPIIEKYNLALKVFRKTIQFSAWGNSSYRPSRQLNAIVILCLCYDLIIAFVAHANEMTISCNSAT